MRRLRLGLLLALCASLAAAAPAAADSFTVVQAADLPDGTPGDGDCDPNDDGFETDDCTLRAAVEEANAIAGGDSVGFAPGLTAVDLTAATLTAGAATCLSACPVSISGAGAVTVRWSGAAGPALLVRPEAAGSSLSGLRIERSGAGAGTLVRVEASDTTLSGLTVAGAAGNGVEVGAAAQTVALSGVSVTGSGADGVRVEGSARSVSISSSTLSANAGEGVEATASTQDVTISGSTISANGGDGVTIRGQRIVVTRSPIFANALAPIALAPGANGDVAPPAALRVGPRRGDGSLPVTGTTPGGTLELFRGDPRGSSAPVLLAETGVGSGSFAYVPAPEPQPGEVYAATFRDARGSSGFATAVVPGDVVSPTLVGAFASSTTEVRVQLSEPVDPASVAPEDFALDMAGAPRAISGVRVEGSTVVLASSGWTHGEAGFVQLAGPGALTDTAGNASAASPLVRVAAAPGDLLAPVPSSLRLSPRRICLTKGRRCRRTGATVRFVASEPGRAQLVIQRGNRRVGVDVTPRIAAGRNSVRFAGRLGGRKLRPGTYRMLLYLEDEVGNRTVEPALTRFTIVRATGRRTSTRRSARRR